MAKEVVQRAQRANPTAKKPAQEKSRNDDCEAPKEAYVKRASGQRVRERHQRIRLQEYADGIR